MINAFRAEWTKLRTVPSNAWLLLALVVLTAGLGAAVTNTVHTDMCATASACEEDTVKLSLSGVWGGQIVAAILGTLAVTNEYSTRLIASTLAARPRRWQVFIAKLTVTVGAAIAAGAVGIAASVAAGRAILPSNGFTIEHGYAPLSLGDGPTARAAVGTVLYLGLIALLALGVGAVLRDTAVSLTVVLAALFVVPLISEFVSDPVWYERLQRWSPTTAGLSIQATERLDELPIAPWPGLGVLALYAVGAAVAGLAVFRRGTV